MSAIIPTRQIRAGLKSIGPMLGPVRASNGVGTDANAIMDSLDKIEEYQNWSKPSSKFMVRQRRGAVAPKLAERLYDALAEAKILTSHVAMHLDDSWRERLFVQLDDLLEYDDWHEDDEPVTRASFETFLRMIVHQTPKRRPGLGVSHRGNLIAAWTSGSDRLTLEFSPGDMVRWVLSCEIDGEVERAAGESPVRRLPEVLSVYRPDRWFSDAKHQAST